MTLQVEETVSVEDKQAAGLSRAEHSSPASDDTGSASRTTPPESDEAASPEPSTAAADAPSEEEFEGDSLLSKEEYSKLKDDPKALRKALHTAFTRKTQELAPYSRVVEALRRDPQAAVRQLARELDIPLADLMPQGSTDQADPATPDPEVEELRSTLSDALGEDLAGKLLPAFQKIVAKTVEERVAPLTEAQERQLMESAIAESESVVNGFKGAYPDYEKYEPRMLELAAEIQPAPGMDESKYLGVLYRLAKSEASEGDKTKVVIDRIKKSAEKSEPITAGTPSAQVSKRPPNLTGKALIRAAVQAASRGETWERD